MPETAVLVREALGRYCPVTNHYQCSDGKYLLVTVKDVRALIDMAGRNAIPHMRDTVRISKHQIETSIDVFLSDENANVLDADGNPANGLTPLAVLEGSDHREALAELGYKLVAAGKPEIGEQ